MRFGARRRKMLWPADRNKAIADSADRRRWHHRGFPLLSLSAICEICDANRFACALWTTTRRLPQVARVFTGEQIESILGDVGVTHVVTIPDSTLGAWMPALLASPRLSVIGVCREGEAWGVAAGLYLGGATPVVIIQCTGLFESGDALRNTLHDWTLPIFSIIGYRSYLNQDTIPGDTCLVFTEPVLTAWQIDWRLIDDPAKMDQIREHYLACRSAGRAGAVVIAEGRA